MYVSNLESFPTSWSNLAPNLLLTLNLSHFIFSFCFIIFCISIALKKFLLCLTNLIKCTLLPLLCCWSLHLPWYTVLYKKAFWNWYIQRRASERKWDSKRKKENTAAVDSYGDISLCMADDRSRKLWPQLLSSSA